jgi:hypothetical protein
MATVFEVSGANALSSRFLLYSYPQLIILAARGHIAPGDGFGIIPRTQAATFSRGGTLLEDL